MKAGILGGGQLGRMLLQAAANYSVETFVMENDVNCPAAHLCHHFTKGDINDFESVYNFAKKLDAVTIEIESVNTDALQKLESEGVKVYPNSSAIKIIKNKILQKQFYSDHQILSPPFVFTENVHQLADHISFLPAVHKIAEGGYDGRGIQILRNEADLQHGFNAPSVLEKMVDIKMEIAVMVAMTEKGETAVYPPAEMIFDPVLNLLDFQISPAGLADEVLNKAETLALKVVTALKSPGIFAVEMFVDQNDEVWVNETAPRVHNSGHHTIEGSYCSQFDMLWRVILGYPPGNTKPILPSAIVNILGEKNFAGKAHYKGLHEVLKLKNAFVHIYGKQQTKPGRKMGHVTILSREREELIKTAMEIKQTLKAESDAANLKRS